MPKYTADTTQLKTPDQVQSTIAALILSETGAQAEITITTSAILIYTEALAASQAIAELLIASGHDLQRVSAYDADDDMPAGITLFFEL